MKKTILISFMLFSLLATAQSYTTGNIYYGHDSLIEYTCGNLPIILSSPHGGYELPSSLPDRNCVGCVTGRDSYTQELTREIATSIFNKTGCYPHVIINKLHRKKLDANREIIEATDSNSITEKYWHDYMNYIDSAKQIIVSNSTKGLFLDIHGHGHSIQRLELGYLLSGTDLRKSDSFINTISISSKSSVFNLQSNNLNSYSHSQLIRGTNSFGAMIQRRGIPAVPSDSIPFPLVGESYFNGGYNTVRFGSKNGGSIDAIQIESHQGVRFDSTTRVKFADSLAETIIEYLEKHYFTNFSTNSCHPVSIKEKNELQTVAVYPNPTTGLINIDGVSVGSKIDLYSVEGKFILTFDNRKSIDLNLLKNGIYFLRVSSGSFVKSIKIIKT